LRVVVVVGGGDDADEGRVVAAAERVTGTVEESREASDIGKLVSGISAECEKETRVEEEREGGGERGKVLSRRWTFSECTS
jgi:hypothetical protein